MSRIAETFAQLKRAGTKGFIPFITAGDPNLAVTHDLIIELSNAGASVIELGVPFSDPMADGPVIQRASERALRNAFGISAILETAARASEKIETPIVLFGYFNPFLQYGIERLAAEAKTAGIDGILITDLAPEESKRVAELFRAHDLDMIFLIAPTSTDERLKMIAERASGFIYAVSRAGVTGTQSDVSAEAAKLVNRVREFSPLPIAVGFGISNAEQVRETWRYADAAVVGSAIVAEIQSYLDADCLVKHIGDFARGLLPNRTRMKIAVDSKGS